MGIKSFHVDNFKEGMEAKSGKTGKYFLNIYSAAALQRCDDIVTVVECMITVRKQ